MINVGKERSKVMQYIYTRPTYLLTAKAQNKHIIEHFKDEWNDISLIIFCGENRLKTSKFEQMLAQVGNGDVIYCYDPAIFGIGIGRCVENLRKILVKGATIKSVLYGNVTEVEVTAIEIGSKIVEECCSIERTREIAHNKGVREVSGGYFDEDTGLWRQGQKKSYVPPHWAFVGQKNTDEARFARESSAARRWVDMKIMQAWTTERILAEYRDLAKVLPEDAWEKISKQWINIRRLELIK